MINQATNARILTDHNSSNSIVKVFGIIGTGTNALQRTQVPGLFDASGRQMFGVKTKIHFDVDSACMFEYVGVYSNSTSGSNVNGFFNDSASIGIGADGFVYIAPSSDSSSIPGNSNEWVFFNIPLILC